MKGRFFVVSVREMDMRITGHRFVTDLFNIYFNPFLTHIVDLTPVSGGGEGRIANYLHDTREKLYRYGTLHEDDILALGYRIASDIVGMTLYNPQFLEQNPSQTVYQYVNPFCRRVAEYAEKEGCTITLEVYSADTDQYVNTGTVTIYPTDQEQVSETFEITEAQPLTFTLQPGIYLVRGQQKSWKTQKQDETIIIALADNTYALTLVAQSK